MPDLPINEHRLPTFTDIRQHFSGLDPSLEGKHLRLDDNRGLHLHDSGKLSGIGAQAMQRRSEKHANAFDTVMRSLNEHLRGHIASGRERQAFCENLLRDVLGERNFDHKLISVGDLARIGERVDQAQRELRQERLDRAIAQLAPRLDPEPLQRLTEQLNKRLDTLDLKLLEASLWDPPQAIDQEKLRKELQRSDLGPLQVLARNGVINPQPRIGGFPQTILTEPDRIGVQYSMLRDLQGSVYGSKGHFDLGGGFIHYKSHDIGNYHDSGDKLHISVRPEQLSEAMDAILPVLDRHPNVIKHFKVTDMVEAARQVDNLDKQIATLRQVPQPDQQRLDQLISQRDIARRVLDGAQLTLYCYQPNEGSPIPAETFREVIDEINAVLLKREFGVGSLPESDLPVTEFVTYRQDRDSQGQYIRTDDENYPAQRELMKERPFYQGLCNNGLEGAARKLEDLARQTEGQGEVRGRRNQDGSISLYTSNREPGLLDRLTGRIREKRTLARQETERVLNELERRLGPDGSHPATRQAIANLRQHLEEHGLQGGNLGQQLHALGRSLHDEHLGSLQQRGLDRQEQRLQQDQMARQQTRARGEEVRDMDGGRVGDGLDELSQEIRDFDRNRLRPTRTVEKGVELDQTPDNEIWRARRQDELAQALPLGRQQVNDRYTEPTLQMLDPEFTETVDFLETSVQLYHALRNGDAQARDTLLQHLGDGLSETLRNNVDRDGQISLAISPGTRFIDELAGALERTWPPQGLGEDLHEFCSEVYARAVSRLDDRVNDDGSVRINGVTYILDRNLGAGSFGRVDRYVDGDGNAIVLKTPIVQESQSIGKRVEESHDEVRAHRAAEGDGHPRITGFRGAVRGPDGLVRIALEEAPGGSLHGLIQGIEESVQQGHITPQSATLMRITLFRDMLEGLRQVQEARGMSHLDLKSPNFFIGQGGIALVGDFGTSRVGSELTLTQRLVDNPNWLAPEAIVRHQASQNGSYQISNKVDTWSLGITAYELFHGGKTPFSESFMFRTENNLRNFAANPDNRVQGRDIGRDPDNPQPQGLGVTALDRLLNQLLHPDPEQRPGLGQILGGSLFNEPGVGSEEVRELIMAVATRDMDRARELSQQIGV